MIKKQYKLVKDALSYWRVFSGIESAQQYRVYRVLPGDDDLQAAKKLHASVYLARSFVHPTDVVDGIICDDSDPHQKHAEYFVAKRKNEVVGLVRQIHFKGEGRHHDSFPILNLARLFPSAKRDILSLNPQMITEISALAKKTGESSVIPLLLYRALWQHSQKCEHRLWIMACDVRLYERLKILFGESLVQIGERTAYQGGDTIPVYIDIRLAQDHVRQLKKSRTNIKSRLQRKAALFITQSNKNDK